MGEVWLAEDVDLRRRIALKILPPEFTADPARRRRFEREARAVAALNHPNIVTIHSIEECDGLRFFAMEHVEGPTLADAIPLEGFGLEEFLRLAVPMSDAVGAAHRKGVTHRDLKPANVMIDSAGRVKVLDFGLAFMAPADPRLTALAGATPTMQGSALTQEGQIAGTLPYMSPEQVRGDRVDPASDVFSLGVVFYEMLTGRRPFNGDSSATLAASILRDEAVPIGRLRPELPPDLGEILGRCLSKIPAGRYTTAADLRDALGRLSPRAAEKDSPGSGSGEELFQRPAVAVLPFANMSGEPEQEYFVDGITQDIVSALSYWRWFPVIARNSTLAFKNKAVDVTEVGRKLGARYLLEGSVRKAGARIRITAQLVDTSSGHQLWAQRYDRDLTDIFEVQDELTQRIVTSLEPELQRAEQQRALRKPPAHLGSWDCCHHALAHQWKFTPDDYARAIEFARRAIELDPTSSYARSMLAICLYEQTMAGWSADPATAFRECFDTASQAVAIDDGDWLGHFMKGMGYLWTQRAYDLGTQENRRAVALNPSAPGAYHGLACVLSFSGHWAEAIKPLHKLLRLDPQYRFAGSALADISLAHLMLREFDAAHEFAEKAIAAQPWFVRSYQRLASCLGHMGLETEAREVAGQLLQRQPDFSLRYVDSTYPFKNTEDREFFIQGLQKAGLNI
jgi:TolB-like protein/Flp pilus assembly protein TadD